MAQVRVVDENRVPDLTIDILIKNKSNQVLLGLLKEQWWIDGQKSYGVPGRKIFFNEDIGTTMRRNIREEFGADCTVTKHEIISVNANYGGGGHYVGIGIVAEINKEDPPLLLTDDWESWTWFDMDNLPCLFPPTRNLVDSYVRHQVNVME